MKPLFCACHLISNEVLVSASDLCLKLETWKMCAGSSTTDPLSPKRQGSLTSARMRYPSLHCERSQKEQGICDPLPASALNCLPISFFLFTSQEITTLLCETLRLPCTCSNAIGFCFHVDNPWAVGNMYMTTHPVTKSSGLFTPSQNSLQASMECDHVSSHGTPPLGIVAAFDLTPSPLSQKWALSKPLMR
eukprot:3262216-Amphidinium_carterae.1